MSELLFAATWKGSLLVALVLLLNRALRGRIPARWAHALLLVALVRLLLPVAPESPLSLFNLAPKRTVILAPEAGPSAMKMRSPMPVVVPDGGLKPAAPPVWKTALVAIWAIGALLMLLRVVVQTVRVRRMVKVHADDEVTQLVDQCREVMGVRQRVAVAMTDVVDAPALHGFLRPTLLLPPGLSPTQLRFVVLHELAHLRRLDVVTNWIAAIAHALHWFNPLVRLAVSRLAEERELACDALALRALSGAERSAYGVTVLQLLERWRVPQAVPGLVGMSADKQQLKRRIEMIARFQTESRRGVWVALVLALAVTALTDARAEGMKRRIAIAPMSPAAKDVIERLEKNINAQLTSASIDQVLTAVSSLSGVAIQVPDGTIDADVRAAKITLRAENIPGHLVLMESLSGLGLGLRFTETGVEVVKHPELEAFEMAVPAPPPGEESKDRIFIRSGRHAPADGTAKRVAVEVDGGNRKVTLESEDGTPAGVLELKVERAN